MLNRLQDASGGPKTLSPRPELEPIPFRTRLLMLGGLVLSISALHIAGHVDDMLAEKTPPQSATSTELVTHLQEDYENRRDLAVELPLFAAGLTAYVGYLVVSKESENK